MIVKPNIQVGICGLILFVEVNMQKKKDAISNLADRIGDKGLMTDDLVIRIYLLFRSVSMSKPNLP